MTDETQQIEAQLSRLEGIVYNHSHRKYDFTPILQARDFVNDIDTKIIQAIVFDFTTNTATGDGKFYIHIPASMNKMKLTTVHALVVTAGTTNKTNIQIANVTTAVDILSTALTIDSGATGSDTATTQAVIDTTKNTVSTNDILRIDVDAVSTTPAKGLIVTLEYKDPS